MLFVHISIYTSSNTKNLSVTVNDLMIANLLVLQNGELSKQQQPHLATPIPEEKPQPQQRGVNCGNMSPWDLTDPTHYSTARDDNMVCVTAIPETFQTT